MSSVNDRRKANGKRYTGNGLTAKVVEEVTGMMLAQAYMVARSAGYKLRVAKLDGVPHGARSHDDAPTVNVEVVGGFVRRAFA